MKTLSKSCVQSHFLGWNFRILINLKQNLIALFILKNSPPSSCMLLLFLQHVIEWFQVGNFVTDGGLAAL